MESLTDLEAAAVGCVIATDSCTAHFIRTRFRVSSTSRFSNSAGSIYPLMQRLEKRGLLSSKLRREGKRNVRYYSANPQARRALKQWLTPPDDQLALLSIDPLRTRMLYLELLTPRQRAAWLDEIENGLKQSLSNIQESHADQTSPTTFVELAFENAHLTSLARLEWIRLSRRRLKKAGLITSHP